MKNGVISLLTILVLAGFGFTYQLGEKADERYEKQQAQIGEVIQAITKIGEIQRQQTIKECGYYETKEERLKCLEAATGRPADP